MTSQWLLYGAYGYTGELVAREAVRRGLRPLLAGRAATRLAPLAAELGLPYRAFEVADAAAHLAGISAVLNCAGPFAATAPSLVRGCLSRGVHYVDVAGEIEVFQYCRQMSAQAQAQARGILLCPGAGFDIVPTDCLAGLLKDRLPECRRIDLAFSFGTRPSAGTAKTAVLGLGIGGLVRRNHRLQPVPAGYRIRKIRFQDRARWCVTIPWADVYTSGISTGVADGQVYAAVPLLMAGMMRLTSWSNRLLTGPSVQRWLLKRVEKHLAGGPSDAERAQHRSQFWGEAVADDGRRVTATMTAPSVYALTVDVAIGILQTCLEAGGRAGHVAAATLMGSGYIAARPGVELQMGEVADVPPQR